MVVELLERTEIKPLSVKFRRLLLDLDGCIVQYDFPRIVKDFFEVDISSQAIFAYDLADVLGVKPSLINTMFEAQVHGKPCFIDGSLDILNEWESKGYELIIFSNRVKYMGEIGLIKWLIDNRIPFDGIDVNGTGEYFAHIDDSPAKLAATNSEVKLLYAQPWNTRCLDIDRKFSRVHSWQEIREIIK